MISRLYLSIIFLFSFTAISCSGNERMPPNAAISSKEPEAKIEIKQGEDFVIVLEAKPQKGYQWTLEEKEENKIIKFISSRYEPNNDRKTIWTFKALNKGETLVTMNYIQQSKTIIKPLKRQTFYISVKTSDMRGKINSLINRFIK